ncbi:MULTISPECIES: succinate dehydrogenase, cytochrome b556 subunit [Sphingomonas]|uniref:Succinate dehydrogenase cytochrome b556 subunit n=1 Tax=Sphingomonas echinoides TaxID=59803 RepID=A0ABU4PS53_9SPHN|nr:succinate dehydrogenase, cytochrome b556 subunit [Sphingomonas echinoides]MDX5985973.1 succinate dehydrogenase, cytochrome b556 subunit [Sphingomonas echinoides]
MASSAPRARPLSPHLSIWKPGPHMIVSILHRITGDGMATVGTVVLVWWLAALAAGAKSYATFTFVFGGFAGGAIGYLFGIGLTLCFFQHLATGIRHFVLDTGAGYELKGNRTGSIATMVFSVLATAAFWAYLLMVK